MPKVMKVDIFDFDDTIYDGDSSVDFYFFCLKKKLLVIKYLPIQAWHFGLYILGIEEKTEMKSAFFSFLSSFDNPSTVVSSFWQKNERKIKGWYLERDRSTDIIISASPDFLLRPIFEKLGSYKLIATNTSIKTGKIAGKNNFGAEKVKRLNKEIDMKSIKVTSAYSDSLSDMPILNLAEEKYVVKKNKIIKFEDYRHSKIKKIFLQKNFSAFIFIGTVNAGTGVLLAFLFSLIVNSGTLAFIFGYLLNMLFSYFLNSIFTFKRREYSITLLLKFYVSYIPNFLIQLISIYVMVDVLSFNKLLSYIIAVVIGVPVTYAILSIYVFNNSSRTKGLM